MTTQRNSFFGNINLGQNKPRVFKTQGGLFGFGSKTYDGGLAGTNGAAFFDNKDNFLGFGDGVGGIRTSNGTVSMDTLGAGSWMDNGSGNKFILGEGAGAGAGGFSFGDLGTFAGAASGLLQGFAGLKQAQMAEEALGLSRDQFEFQKGLANRNLANQAKAINNIYDSSAQVAAGLVGGKYADGSYGYVDPSVRRQYTEYAKSKHVDGSPID